MNTNNFKNKIGQPIGEIVSNWSSRKAPSHTRMEGLYCFIDILDVDIHGEDLFQSFREDINNQDWTYLPYGPFESKKEFAVWIVRNEEGLYALSTVCTHLGCTPNWLEVEQKYKCPCHGSGFRKSGKNFEGPAPRPLERHAVSLASDGQIIVDKTKRYKWEKGEWETEDSFLKI